jgi:hypothetical protein
MENTNIKFDLWPKGDFSDVDVKQLEECISKIDTVKGRTSSNLRGLEIQAIIQFMSLKVFEGFISKIGSDMYKLVKNGVAKILSKPLKKQDKNLENYGLLFLNTNIERINFNIIYKYENEDDIERLCNSLQSGVDFLKKEIMDKEIKANIPVTIEFDYKKDYESMTINYRIIKHEKEKLGKIEKGTFKIKR